MKYLLLLLVTVGYGQMRVIFPINPIGMFNYAKDTTIYIDSIAWDKSVIDTSYFPLRKHKSIIIDSAVSVIPSKALFDMKHELAKLMKEYQKSLDDKFMKELLEYLDEIEDYNSVTIKHTKDTIRFRYDKGGYSVSDLIIRERPSFNGFIKYLEKK